MQRLSKKALKRCLVLLVLILALLLSLITFSEDSKIPGWKEIGHQLGVTTQDAVSDDFVRFIDVGQGDSILISSNGHNAMIDFGNNADNGRELASKLKEYSISSFDCLFITHYDSDHIGGADTVLDRFDVENVILPTTSGEKSSAYRQVETSLETTDANIINASTGKLIKIGDFNLEIVGYYKNEEESNDRSLVIFAEIDGIKFLFSGDIGTKIENKLMSQKKNIDCDVYKASHHGSKSANSYKFLKYITPEYTVISCGAGNSYGHPHEEVVSSLEKVDSEIYRTDEDGDVTFYINDKKLFIETEIK